MKKKAFSLVLIGFSIFLLIFLLETHTRFFVGMEHALMNGFFTLREPDIDEQNPLVSDEVLLLGFDEDAIAFIGKWPWKRHVHARALINLEKFSPRNILFDVVFVKRETLPPFLSEKLSTELPLLKRMERFFSESDQALEKALSKYHNVFLDMQLVEQPRPDLPKDYLAQIQFNEQFLENFSLPLKNNQSPVIFHSLEPVLSEFIKSANPAIVNVLPDEDGMLRIFPLYYTYRMSNGSFKNLFTSVLALLQKYYRVAQENVRIDHDRIILSKARVPQLDSITRKPKVYRNDLNHVKARVQNPLPPKSYVYNQNLFHLISNTLLLAETLGDKIPIFPLHVLEEENGRLTVLDGWEIYDAAIHGEAMQIDVIKYDVRDVNIETPVPGFYRINYAGTEKRYFIDPQTGAPAILHTIPTESYGGIYAMASLPPIPELNIDGNIKHGQDTRTLEKWFFDFCENESYRVYRLAASDLGDDVQDDARFQEYLNQHPDQGKFFWYAYFFKALDAKPGMLEELLVQYPDFGRQMGQPPAHFLSQKVMVRVLMEQYRTLFIKYYNKFIFAGATAGILGDVQQTPYGAMNGINTLIHAFNTIVTQNQLTQTADIPMLDFWLMLCLCLFCALTYGLTSIRTGSLLVVFFLIGTVMTAYGLFSMANLFLTTAPLLISNIIIFVAIVVYKVLTEQKDKKFLKKTFSSYLSPEIIDEMYETKTMPTLGGEARPITAFFTDIQGFSTFSEKLTAEQLVELINEYLSAMTDILISERGTLDKYEGDAIIAFFGAPMTLPDHSLRACRVALRMQQKLDELREKWGSEKQDPHAPNRNTKGLPLQEWEPQDKWPRIVHHMKMRIGINTGEIVVGNMGSAMRMNYTMMGDPVNLAARLEAAGKQYGVYILVSEETLNDRFIDENGRESLVKDRFEARYIDRIAVVGKSEPVRVYEICALKGELTERETALFQVFDEGIAHYLAMKWDRAGSCFEKALKLERFADGKTTPSAVYLSRCRDFMKNPPVSPGKTWDGVYRLTRK